MLNVYQKEGVASPRLMKIAYNTVEQMIKVLWAKT